jgi:GTP cyclohydrolase IA
MQDLIRELIIKIGEDPDRKGMVRTPERVEKSFRFLTSGYQQDIEDIINKAVYEEKYDEMVIVKDIDLFSLCEHHMLPFYGKCHVAYIPDGKLIGLSKLPRIVEAFSRRLQIQERLTTQIADCINDALQPKGVAVVVEAYHLCIAMRGVEKLNAAATTSAMHGLFIRNRSTRMEFMDLLGLRSCR